MTMNRRQWCALVATLCAPGMVESASASLAAMLPALQHFPEYLFTEETAKAVAMGPRKLACPAWDEITRALNAYRREFVYEPPRRSLPAPSQPEREPPTDSEIEAVSRSVAAALSAIAEERAKLPPEPKPVSTLPDVSFSGQRLGELRRQRFAELQSRGGLQGYPLTKYHPEPPGA